MPQIYRHETARFERSRQQARGDYSRCPSRRAPARRRVDLGCWQATSGKHPRDHRIRVPHLADAEFVSPPHERRYVFSQRKDVTSLGLIVTQAPWACHRLLRISDRALAPPPHLVAKEPEATEVATSDWPSTVTPRDIRFVFGMGQEFSMTKRPSGTVTSSAEW